MTEQLRVLTVNLHKAMKEANCWAHLGPEVVCLLKHQPVEANICVTNTSDEGKYTNEYLIGAVSFGGGGWHSACQLR